MIERRLDVSEQQREQQFRAQTMRNVRRMKMEVGQGRAGFAENDWSRAAQDDHPDTAGDHAEDDNVESDVNAACQLFLP